jgi:hypothetical protein
VTAQRNGPAMCIRSEGYPASLEIGKLYRVVPDAEAQDTGHIRVIDESGEDYLYPMDYFVTLDLPHSVKEALEGAA